MGLAMTRPKAKGMGSGGHRPQRVTITLDYATAEAVKKRQALILDYTGAEVSFSAACAALIRNGVKNLTNE